MERENAERRLAAILAADVAGYTRLMEADEEATLAAWWSARQDIIDPRISEHGGRIVKHTGDGFLAEFATVLDAVRCAVSMQRDLVAGNAGVAEDRLFAFRMGINLGDIVVDDEDIYGDGVNIAARIESLSDPGGICISGSVHDQVHKKLGLNFEDMGEQAVKHIERPIRIYRIKLPADSDAGSAVTGTSVQASVGVSAPVPGFGRRPAIAVLPFDNMSRDPDQEYFADGITEDILTRLASWRWMPVIGRNSTFAYKGQAVDVKRIGQELGARYVLEGSVRRAGDKVRITGQLIDADSGHHVWAERYDRQLDDIFALQDEITEAIVTALEPAVGKAEMRRVGAEAPANLDAWEILQKGIWHFHKTTKEDFAVARGLFRQAMELDPRSAQAPSMLTILNIFEIILTWAENPPALIAESQAAAQAALNRDDANPYAHIAVGAVNMMVGQLDAAVRAMDAAIEINPSLAIAHYLKGPALMFAGLPEEAAVSIEAAVRLSPNDLYLFMWCSTLSASYYMAGQNENALEAARKAVERNPGYPLAQRTLASALAQLGRRDEARAALARFIELVPGYSFESAKVSMPFKDPEDYAFYFEGIRKVGWPG